METFAIREDLHEAVQRRVREHMADRITSAARYGPHHEALWRIAAEGILGGKMLRPRLLVDMHAALDPVPRTSREPLIELAAGVEMLHYAFLLHDDVIDGDLLRRNAPNLIGLVRSGHPHRDDAAAEALHWANSSAVLMGDLLLAAVHQIFARVEVDPGTRVRLLDLLDHTVAESVAGEHVDVALSDRVAVPELPTILEMTANKTATYTFEMPVRIAAILAGLPERTEHALASVGRHLGLAFQLQDDELSVFGDPGEHGKEPYSDLREGKETALVAYARLTSAWRIIEPRFGSRDLTAEDGERMADALRDCGADRFLRSLIEDEVAAAAQALAEASVECGLPPAVRAVLIRLSDDLEGRTS